MEDQQTYMEHEESFVSQNVPEKNGNRMATASMVLGISSFFGICCCGIGGIVLGCLGILFGLLSRTEERFETRAIAGIITGAVATVLSVLVIVVLVLILMAEGTSAGGGLFY